MKKTPLLSVIALSSLFLGVGTIFGTGPNTPPPNGGYTGGLFSVYFKNIIEGAGSSPLGKCPSGYGIVGYSSTNDASYGTPLCEQITSSSYWYPNGANIYYTGGNVGIGTNIPSAKLEVVGQVKITGGNPGANKVLTSDATGLASWVNPNPCTPGGSGTNNICLGTSALGINTSGDYNTAIGVNAMANNTTGSNNTANGFQALQSNTTGNGNIAIGYRTLFSNTSGTYNIGIGENSLYTNTTGVYNVGVGYYSLYGNTTGVNNTAAGFYALRSNTTGQSNVGVGHTSLYSNTTGLYGTAVGASALYSNTSGIYNTAIGGLALNSNNVGRYNTAVGTQALYNNISGQYNTAVGTVSMYSNTAGQSNVAIGRNALYNMTGNNNTAMGDSAGSTLSTGNNNILIGYNIQPNISSTGSNQLNIGNWIYGNNGNIGIGSAAPATKLEISDNPVANNASFRIATTSNGFTQYLPNMTVGAWNSTVQAGDHSLIFSTDNVAGAIDNNGLVIGAWNGGALRIGEDGVLRSQSTSGYADIGAQSAGYFHFYTDRPEFYMNKKLNVDGAISVYGVANQWAQVNANTYMANTSMYSYGRICVGNMSGDCNGAGGAVLGDNSNANLSLGTDGNIRMRNVSPTIFLRDTDNRSSMIHNNSNLLYFLRGCGNDSDSWCANGAYWPMTINLENNDVTIGGNAYAAGYYYLSDKNLKKDIKSLDGALEKLTKLNGYSFNWKSNGKKDLGVIAQEVEKVFPELVGESKNAAGDTSKTVQYGNLVAPIIEAIKELAHQQKAHNKEIEELKEQNENLQKRLEALEKKMQ